LEVTSLDTGALNGELLFKSAVGNQIDAVASADQSGTAGSNTATLINVAAATGSNYTVGQALKVSFSTPSADEYVVIRSISTDALTVSPALTGVPTDVTDVEGLMSFTIARPDTPAVSLAVKEYIENATSKIAYTYHGVVATDMALEFPLANIVKATFTLAGAGFDVASGVSDEVRQCFDLSPYIAKNMTFTYDGTSYDASDLTMNVASDIVDIEAVTTDGLTNKVVTGKSNVGGSFTLEYSGVDLFNTYQNGTDGELFGTVSNATTTFGFYAPKVILTNAAKSIDAGLYRENIEYTCLSASCSDTTEDALTIFFS
jgi:hypothetical protein